MDSNPAISPDYKSLTKVYKIVMPEIPSDETYYFETDSGLQYQVRFANKTDNYLEYVLNFSVLSEEFEDEYAVTNRFEVFRIISTVIEIVRLFHEQHPLTEMYEFNGEFKRDKDSGDSSIRSRLYYRNATRTINKGWKVEMMKNKVVIRKIRNQ